MEPFIHVGDRVVIEAVNTSQLFPGDIILYFNGHRFCTHRFVRILKDGKITKIVTKGDHLQGFDLPFEEDKYLGKVITILRKDKNINLRKNRYRILNKIMGKLLTLQWVINNTGQQFTSHYNVKSNQLMRLSKKIINQFFYLFNRSIEYIYLSINTAEDK